MILKLPGRQLELKNGLVAAGAAAAATLLLLGCLIGTLLFREENDIIVESSAAEITSADTGTSGTAEAIRQQGAASVSGAAINTSRIKVYVVGCVNKPGIVTLEKGQLIDDAIRMAGGLTKEADADGINMVYALNENTMLRIKPEEPANRETSTASGAAKAGGKAQKEGKNAVKASNPAGMEPAGAENAVEGGEAGGGVELTGGSGAGVEMMNAAGKEDESAGTSSKSSAVNINTADAAELDTLPGIGQATARDIIAFREKNGRFKKIEDIMQVPRIKQNRFDNIKESICVN